MFSENQKFYLKRLAALHDFKNGRKAVYLQQKKEKTWAAYDLPHKSGGCVSGIADVSRKTV